MADNSGATGLLGLIIGGLIVAVAVLAFVVYGGQGAGPSKVVSVELPTPAAPK
jgi:hypothetical protein